MLPYGLNSARSRFGQDFKILAVIEIGPSRPIRKRIGIHRRRDVEERFACPGRGCDTSCRADRVERRRTSIAEAPSDWCRCRRRDRRTRLSRRRSASAPVRASCRPRICAGSPAGPTMTKSLYITSRRSMPKPSATNLLLADAIVNQERIGIAARSDRKRLPGADRHHVNAQAASPRGRSAGCG